MISEKQKKILAFEYTNYDAIICDGAVRSGKTTIMMWAFVKWAMNNFDRCLFGICGKTVDSAIKNIIMPFLGMTLTKNTYRTKWNRTSKILVIEKGNKKNTFEIFGGKDEASQSLIQGRTLAGVFLDEVVLMPQSFVNQALVRCSVSGSRYWFSDNPASPSHWFYKEWIQKTKEKNALYLHFRLSDNPSLDEKTLKRYENVNKGVFYERFVLGLWVNASGIIYRQFADNRNMFLIEKVPEILQIVSIGIDYGAGRSKTSMKAVGISSGYRNIYVLDEFDCEGVYDPDTLYRKFHDFYKRIISGYNKCHYVLGDWGGLGNTLNKGLYVYCRKNNIPVSVDNCEKGTILERIELTSKLFAEHRLFIMKSCTNIINAFCEAMWDDKKPDTRLDDGTTDIDSLDAFEYAVFPFEENILLGTKYEGR